MGQSILVFMSHSSEDKSTFIEPLVQDLEDCYINVWIDKRKIMPGDNLRKSIFREGLDKADVVLIFFTEKSIKSSWVDREIKHVLRDDSNKEDNFDIKKIISIFDSENTYKEISSRYPELIDDLLYLMPVTYTKIHLGQLISAIWSKYFSLQGRNIETQKKILDKDKELLQKNMKIFELEKNISNLKDKTTDVILYDEFKKILDSKKVEDFIKEKDYYLTENRIAKSGVENASNAMAFGLVEYSQSNSSYLSLSKKGKDFFKWYTLNYE